MIFLYHADFEVAICDHINKNGNRTEAMAEEKKNYSDILFGYF